MKVFVPRILTSVLACLIVVETVTAQTDPIMPGDAGTAVIADPTMSPPLISDAPGQAVAQNYFGYTEVDRAFEPLMRVDTRGGSLFGQQGFTRVSGFVPYWYESDALLFLDVGGFATYRPAGGANIGVGWRYYLDDLDRMFGVNGWYDYDAGHQDQYHQFGVGFESLGRYLDYRVNGYFPLSSTSNLLGNGIVAGGNPKFVDHFIYLDRYYRHETAFRGFDAEMGGPTPFFGKYGLNAYAGMYFFTGLNVGNITGVSARLTGQINEDLTVGAQFTHDSVFDNNVQIQVTWTIPDGKSNRWLRNLSVRDRLTAPVLRNYRVVAHDEVVIVSEKAINPVDNLPYFVAHIDPNGAPGTGNGTVENPYAELAQFDTLPLPAKSNYDIIYVSPRDDDTSTQLNTGVTLLSNQRLLSTSVAHEFDVIQAQMDVTGSTSFALPGFVPGELPILSNTAGGHVVTLTTGARNVEVSGFEISGSATPNALKGDGIHGVNNQKVDVNRNVIVGNAYGVSLENLSGTGDDASSFDSNQFLSNFRRDAFGTIVEGDGLRIINNPGTPDLELSITDNTFALNGFDGLHIEALGSNISGLIDGNTTMNTASSGGNGLHGAFFLVDAGSLDFFTEANGWAISNNTFNFNGGDGIHIESVNNSDVRMRIIDSTFGDADIAESNNAGFGVFYSALGGTGTMLIDGNDFFSNTLGGIRYDLSADNVTVSQITNNTMISGSLIGLGFQIIGDTFGQPFSITNTSQPGFNILAFELDLTPSGVVWDTEEPGASIPFAPLNGTDVTTGLANVNGNPYPNNLPSGGLPDDQPLLDLTFTNFNPGETFVWEADVDFLGQPGSTVQGNDLVGSLITIDFTGGQTLSGTLQPLGADGSQFVATGGSLVSADAIQINTFDTARLIDSSISGNSITGHAGYGIHVNATDSSQVTNLLIDSNDITSNDGGIRLEGADNTIIDAIITNNVVSESRLSGVELYTSSNNANAMTILSEDNVISLNNVHGMSLLTSGAAIVDLVSNRDQFLNNGEDGFKAQSSDTTQVSVTLNNVTATGNGLNGVEFTSTAFSIMDVVVASPSDILFEGIGSVLNNNGANGIAANSTQNSQMYITAFGNNTSVTGNTGDGIHLSRADASVFIADFNNMLITGNQDDGIQFDAIGGAPSDPNQPFPGTTSQLLLSQVGLNGNGSEDAEDGGNGLEIHTYADAILVASVVNSTFNNNFDNGIRAFSGDNSSFGENTGNRSIFDNVQVTGNGSTGVKLMSAGNNTQKSRMFVEFNSDSGNTNISDNGLNGIQASVPYGFLDLLVQGDTVGPANFQTKIQRNAGDGIQFNVADIAQDGSDVEQLLYEFGAEFGNDNNLTLVNTNVFNAVGTLTVNNTVIGDENPNDAVNNANAGDGINVYVGNSELYAANAAAATLDVFHLLYRSGQVNLNVDQSVIQGNGGNGILVDSQGVHTYDPFFFSPQGNLVNANITNSLIGNNALHGVDFEIDGMHGRYALSGGFVFGGTIERVNSNEILMDNNVIQNNGGSGVKLEVNVGQMLRYDFQNANGGVLISYPSDFWGILFADPGVSPGDGVVFNPTTLGTPFGWAMVQSGYAVPDVFLSSYLNVMTDSNTNLRFYRNAVQFNGIAENGTDAGLNIRVSTDAYVSADIGGAAGSGLGNSFSGNIGGDVKFRSFSRTDANGNVILPGPSTPGDDTAAPPTYDHIFLDDTAQLDVRFNNNRGNTLDAVFAFFIGPPGTGGLTAAGYDNVDPNKGSPGGQFRPTQIFQVDDGFNLNANNTWTQDLPFIFNSDGNFHLRTVADPLFPNPAFPENFNTDPGDPFLP